MGSRGTTRKPVTPREGNTLSLVADPIDPMTGQWDSDLLNQLFWPEDVHTILSIAVFKGSEDVQRGTMI